MSPCLLFALVLTFFVPISLLCFMENEAYSTSLTSSDNGSSTDMTQTTNIVYLKNGSLNISSPPNNIHTGEFSDAKIALVKPTFTDAAYNNAFYVFYEKYKNIPKNTNVTKDLNLLNSQVKEYQSGTVGNVYAMLDLIKNLEWISNTSKIDILTDNSVDNGSIFSQDDQNVFDVLILGHQEYVTQKEYDNLKQFVTNGGTLIILDGNVFYAQVKYFDSNNTISLVKGHGWAFNGKSAWNSVNERWKNETEQWVGSNYICYLCITKFSVDPFNYKSHEEQMLTNPKDVILLNYDVSGFKSSFHHPTKNIVVATYELKYGKGKVIALSIFSDDVIQNGNFVRYFDSLFKYAMKPD